MSPSQHTVVQDHTPKLSLKSGPTTNSTKTACFLPRTIKDWNTLPTHLVHVTSVDEFGSRLQSLTIQTYTVIPVFIVFNCDKVCQWLATDWWFSLDSPDSSTNKTDYHNITEIQLKVVLNTINQLNSSTLFHSTLSILFSEHFIINIISESLFTIILRCQENVYLRIIYVKIFI